MLIVALGSNVIIRKCTGNLFFGTSGRRGSKDYGGTIPWDCVKKIFCGPKGVIW